MPFIEYLLCVRHHNKGLHIIYSSQMKQVKLPGGKSSAQNLKPLPHLHNDFSWHVRLENTLHYYPSPHKMVPEPSSRTRELVNLGYHIRSTGSNFHFNKFLTWIICTFNSQSTAQCSILLKKNSRDPYGYHLSCQWIKISDLHVNIYKSSQQSYFQVYK